MARRFLTLDVFTEQRLAGNPLAVVLESEGLDDAAMQAIAREFNLSETVFVLPPTEARHRARLRIFTPGRELPFAGHPTVGAAVLLALQDPARGDARAFGLEEGIGIVPCVVETLVDGTGGRARFRLPILPEFLGPGPEPETLAPLLGLTPGDIGTGRHVPSRHGVGPSFTCVPVASVAALDAARPAQAPDPTDGLYLYTPDPEGAGQSWRVRMFAPNFGVPEDPATGSAASAFAGVLMQFETLGEGTHDVAIRQGQAMGRPSTIALQLTIAAGALRGVEIGGAAVIVSDGTLHV
ncbi:PhzF family phenazine biosynthesis protein [Methylobacterium sp. PvR107]|uniref:PhzF family phenazine biosynthesis protein n=1 Tax=Methylobacterium sp. PvR107 TaxID=2806597 RepID=UPI001AE91B55|nr:PhzF family phenazine biosynthesis protein [Methylobacterium sp. PvR107]MBP1183707.1 trans-2,3-dihydro-3-hydroxyanthranilate isomerase [Methylobacterium sp. PvR107]